MIRRVLITGGAGYVGSALFGRLLGSGFELTIFDSFLFGNHLPADRAATVIEGDIRDRDRLTRVMEGQEAVVHLAYLSVDGDYGPDRLLGESINVEGLATTLELCRIQGVKRFIFPSSCSVYGVSTGGEGVDESSRVEPLSDYARHKERGEALVLSAAGLCRVVVRMATVCGVAPRQRLDLLINRMVMHAVCSGRIPTAGPDCIRPCVHVRDASACYQALLAAPEELIDGQVFNVAYENRSVGQLAELIRDEVPGSVIDLQDSSDPRSYSVRSDKIGRVLAFRPRYGVRDAIVELKGALERGIIADPLGSPQYINRSLHAGLPSRPALGPG
jgi:nucleoside-diphosphate-sugar epimerase